MSVFSESGFEALFKKYFVALTAYCNKFVKDTETAKDIVHKGFMNLWEKRSQIPDDGNIPALLYRTVRNLSLNYLRDNRRIVSPEEFPEVLDENSSADTAVQAAELEAKIVSAVRGLPERSREIFLMSRYGKMTNKSISEQLKVSVKTVEAHITSTLKTLKACIFGKS